MSNQRITHCGFSDESSWNKGRYRSISLVTGMVGALKAMENALDDVLNESNIKELKWKDTKSAKKVQAAIQMLPIVADCAASQKCRVDTLIWDAKDTRHDVRGRDDQQNLGRMYYHLSLNVLQKKWPSDATWMILPDEHHQINWGELEQCLDAVSVKPSQSSQASFPDVRGLGYRKFNIEKIKPVQSQKYRLTQLADFFAGVSVFSWNNHEDFRSWENEQPGQQSLFGEMQCSASKNSRERFRVLQELIKVCCQRKFALSTKPGGLKTPVRGAKTQINFWFYQPQGDYDKAPTRNKTRGGRW